MVIARRQSGDVRAVTIEIVCAPFACEIYAGDDAAVLVGIEEFMMIGIKAGIENGDAYACAVELARGRSGKAANLISARGFFNMAGNLCDAIKRNVDDIIARRQRRERRQRHAETDGVEVGEGALEFAALALHDIL